MNRSMSVEQRDGLWYVNGYQVDKDTIECIFDALSITADHVFTGDQYVCLKCGYMGSSVEHNCGERRYQTFAQCMYGYSTPTVKLSYDDVYRANGYIIDRATVRLLIGFDPHDAWRMSAIVTDGSINVCRACGKVMVDYDAENHTC